MTEATDIREQIKVLERENRRLRELAASLDEMPRKRRGGTVSDLKGIEDIHTGITKRVRSMPGGEDKMYLELYLLQKEQQRLVKETTWVKKRRLRIGNRYEDNKKEIADREEKALEQMSVLSPEAATGQRGEAKAKEAEPKKWDTMTVDF